MILASYNGHTAATAFFLTIFMWMFLIIGVLTMEETNRSLARVAAFLATMIAIIVAVVAIGIP